MSELAKKRSEMELDTQRRRSELLAQTRAQYSDKYTPPAIHPRWQNTYQSLYHNEDSNTSGGKIGSFGVRMIIAIMLFCLFALADYQGMKEAKTVTNEIVQDYVGFVDFDFLD